MRRQKGELLPPGLGRLAAWPVPNNSFICYSSLSYCSHCMSLRNKFISVAKIISLFYFKAIQIAPYMDFSPDFTMTTFSLGGTESCYTAQAVILKLTM
jgi:hypothetical protein